MRVILMLSAILSCCLAGCPEIFEAETAPADSGAESSSQAKQSPQPPVLPSEPPGAGIERVKAEAGVAAAGRSLDNEKGVARVVVEPVRTLFAFKENAVFKIQIPQAMQLFKATEGRFPRSHEEFMNKIVGNNKLRLPELPEGHRYVYDPKDGELKVERPVQ